MLKDFLSKLFPPELVAYIPGQKLIVGALATAVATLFGVDIFGETEVLGVDLPLGAVVLAIAVYLWPEDAISV